MRRSVGIVIFVIGVLLLLATILLKLQDIGIGFGIQIPFAQQVVERYHPRLRELQQHWQPQGVYGDYTLYRKLD